MALHPLFADIIHSHARVTEAVTHKADGHRGWSITWDYGFYTGTGPNYDASYEGEEDGWVDNGHRVTARTRDALISEIDAWFEEQASQDDAQLSSGKSS
jgi:hypothetical protein